MDARPVLGLPEVRKALLDHVPPAQPREGQACRRAGVIVTVKIQTNGDNDDLDEDPEEEEDDDLDGPRGTPPDDEEDDADEEWDDDEDEPETWQVSQARSHTLTCYLFLTSLSEPA